MKNHIKFAYLIKWLDSLASQWSRQLSQPESRPEGEPKKKTGFKKRLEVATTAILGKLWKPIKIKQVCKKPDFWIRESVTRRKGVSNLQRPSEGGTFN